MIQKESYAIPRQNVSAYQYFGNGISISGNTALIGSAYGGALAGKYLKLLACVGIMITFILNLFFSVIIYFYRRYAEGQVYEYLYQNGEWKENSFIVPSGALAHNDQYSAGASILGNRAVVCAPMHNSEAGIAFVFERVAEGKPWAQVATLDPPRSWNNGRFGASAALTESRIVIGSYAHDTGTPYTAKGWVGKSLLTHHLK